MAEKKVIEIEVKTSGAVDSVNKLDDSLKKVSSTTDEVGSQGSSAFKGVGDSVSGVFPALSGAVKGMKAVIVQMWAIVSNPLGLVLVAIVGALTLLYKAFASTKEGAEQLEQIMSGVGAVIDVVRDRILKVGNAIVKFFKGDFKGAIAEGRAAVNGFGEEVAKEFKIAAEAAKSLQEVDDAMRDLSVSRAKLNRDLAESERVLTDVNATYAEKLVALKKVEAAEKKQTDSELENARKKLKAIEAQNKQSSSSESLQAAADARISVLALEQKSAEDRRKVADFNKTLNNEEQSRLKALEDIRKANAVAAQERAKARQELAKQEITEELTNAKLGFEEQRKLVLENNKLSKKDSDEFLKKINESELKSIEDHKKAISDLEDKYETDLQNLKAKTEQEKLDLQKKRDISELERIATTREEQENLKLLLNKKYKILQDELDLKTEEEDKTKKDAKDLKDIEDLKKLEQEKLNIKLKALDDLAFIFGAESSLGQKLLIAKQLLLAKELILEVTKTIAFSKQAFIRSNVAVAEGVAQTAKVGFPQNIPLLIGYAAQAVGIISAIKSATKKANVNVGSEIGSIPSGGGGSAPSQTAPRFNIVGAQGLDNQIATGLGTQPNQPIRAYVVSNEVTTQQSLDRNIIQNASLG